MLTYKMVEIGMYIDILDIAVHLQVISKLLNNYNLHSKMHRAYIVKMNISST